MRYEAVIGLEIHVQILTKTKTFCRCSTAYGDQPNSHTCPVCLGLPGALPVLNEEALRKAIIAGVALGCDVSRFSVFARKNYFYPDLPKSYQISQYELPLNAHGAVTILDERNREKRIGITRAHLEEDAGKLIHDEDSRGPSYVDFNRCGVPLLEIVTEPDMRTAGEAYGFLSAVKEIMQYTGVSECSMEKGELRVDVNVSLREAGSPALGVKQEIKNMNSFANVRKAIDYEILRQTHILSKGGALRQETRLFDQGKYVTIPMRTKEEAHDYRYFPDPDLVPVELDESFIQKVRDTIPELPAEKRKRFIAQYGLTPHDAETLCSSAKLADYFEETARGYTQPKKIANWIMSEFLKVINEKNIEVDQSPVTPSLMRELFTFIDEGQISGKIAKGVFQTMCATGKTARSVIEEQGLRQVTDQGSIGAVVDEVLSENRAVVMDVKNGKEKAFGFLVGQVMKKTGGRANPRLVNDRLRKEIERI